MSCLDVADPSKVAAAIARLRANDPAYITDFAAGDERFGLWLRLVDEALRRATGLTHRELADWRWREAFDGGLRPATAAGHALAADLAPGPRRPAGPG